MSRLRRNRNSQSDRSGHLAVRLTRVGRIELVQTDRARAVDVAAEFLARVGKPLAGSDNVPPNLGTKSLRKVDHLNRPWEECHERNTNIEESA